jgi:hypothetical protein
MERDFLKGIFGVDRSGKYFHHIVALISIGIFGGGKAYRMALRRMSLLSTIS